MTNTTQTPAALVDATTERDAARARFDAARPNTKAWRKAGDDLNFWQGKVTALKVLHGLTD